MSNSFVKRTWAEINLDALDRNIEEIRRVAGGKEIVAVVKANAYGHDDKTICTELARLGIRWFAVSNLWEAEDCRVLVPQGNILIFGYTEPDFAGSIIENDLIQTVGSVEYAKRLDDAAKALGGKIRIHIKVNTGMTRVGIDREEELLEILSLKNLSAEGAYTHFAVADSQKPSDMEYTEEQQRKLLSVAGSHGLLIHSQNSGGILYHRGFPGDLVRAGVIMYGLMPNTGEKVPLSLTPVMTVKSAICQLKRIPAGTSVSYGRTYMTGEERLVAVLPVGYADGYSRKLSNIGNVVIRGQISPIIGRICMDQTIVDVTDIAGVSVGDEAEVYSATVREAMVDNIADRLGTIGYELVCGVGHRVPRIAVRSGEVLDVVRYG